MAKGHLDGRSSHQTRRRLIRNSSQIHPAVLAALRSLGRGICISGQLRVCIQGVGVRTIQAIPPDCAHTPARITAQTAADTPVSPSCSLSETGGLHIRTVGLGLECMSSLNR